jgi:hypothetical protein
VCRVNLAMVGNKEGKAVRVCTLKFRSLSLHACGERVWLVRRFSMPIPGHRSVSVKINVCVCVCVCERERERERVTEHARTHSLSHRPTVIYNCTHLQGLSFMYPKDDSARAMQVCVCVCVSVCTCVYVCVSV